MNSMKRVGEQMLGGEQEENPHGGSAEGRREWGMPDMEVLPGPAAEEARGGGHQRVEVPLGFADGQSIGGAVYQWSGAGGAVGQGAVGSAVGWSGAGSVADQSELVAQPARVEWGWNRGNGAVFRVLEQIPVPWAEEMVQRVLTCSSKVWNQGTQAHA